ncbi:MAG: hypothetical protein OXH01_02345 [Bacteroidetes bacterium]|nr:hypothetical protein [Bacteroidota bacterium]
MIYTIDSVLCYYGLPRDYSARKMQTTEVNRGGKPIFLVTLRPDPSSTNPWP